MPQDRNPATHPGPGFFWLTDLDSGKPREKLYGDPQSLYAAIHPEDRRRVADAIKRGRESGFEVAHP